MKKITYMNINGKSSKIRGFEDSKKMDSRIKRIVHYPLSIVHCALLIILFLWPLGKVWGQTVSWGSASDYTGTTNYSYNSPFGRYYGWEYKVFCYRPNTLPFSGNITSISFLPSVTNSTAGTKTTSTITINGSTDGNPMQIWMKEVAGDYALDASTTFSTYVSGATKVYSGNIPATTSGTQTTFSLSTSFTHTQANSLLILVRTVANGTSGDGACNCYYKELTGGVNLCWYKQKDTSDPDINVSGSCITNNLPVISLTYASPNHTVTAVAGTGIASAYVAAGTSFSGTATSVSVNPNGSATFKATVSAGYTFDGWYNGSTRVSTNLQYTVNNINSNLTLTAKANLVNYAITSSVASTCGMNQSFTISVSPSASSYQWQFKQPSETSWTTCVASGVGAAPCHNGYSNGTSQTITINSFADNVDIQWRCRVNGSTYTDPVTIHYHRLPTITFPVSSPYSSCGSVNIAPTIGNTNCGNVSWAWSGSGSGSGTGTPVNAYNVSTTGNYIFTVNDSYLQQYDLIVQNGVPAIVVDAPTASTTGKAVPIGTDGIGSNTSAGNIAYDAATNLQRAIVVNGGVRYDSGNRTGYVIPIQSCTATASIDVTIDVPPTLTHISGSTSQDACIDNAIENIVYHYTPANASVSVSGLPSGVDYTANSGVLTISGSPTVSATYSYTVTVSSGSCPSATPLTGTIKVANKPNVSVNSPQVCKGSSVTLLASGATSYTWSPTTYLSSGSGSSVSFSSSSTNTYTVTVTGTSANCSNFAVATVTVKDKVTPTFTNPGPICSGATLTLPASSNNNSNLTGSAVTGTWSPTVNNTATTTYTFTPTASPDQCASTATMTVTVNSLPTPTISGETSPCSGESTTLDAGSGYASYLWYDGTTGQTISPTPSAPTEYSVTVYDGNTCSASTSVTVSPINCCNLTATLSSSSSPSCYNECDGTITVTVDGGTAPITYIWSDGESGTSLYERTGLCADTYTVTVSDANGCVAGGIRETTTECFRITDIMYHSCNADHQEGFNEMFTMLIGPNNLDADNMDISWANNNLSFTGFCENQDAIDGINALITGGGRVIAPVGGILPANSEVLVVTSQNFDYGSFGFTDLDHDVYILFQCNDDVTDGHFGNTPNGSERHFGVSFSSPSCSDNVSYITTTNVAGDAVHYNADGTVEYYNNGCQAPVFYDEIVLTNPEEITLSYSSISGYQNVDLAGISPVTNCTGTATYTSSDLPDGLALDSSTGVISGTPEHQEDGSFSVTITCDGCDVTYTVDYHFDEEPDYQGCVIEEDFSEITTGGNTATTGTNGPLGTELAQNSISDFPTTSRAYAAGGVVKLGSSSYSGYIQTAPLNLSVPFYVEFDVKGWTNVEGDIVVTVSGGETQTVSYTATIGSDFETKRINFNAATSNSTVRIATSAKRAFIDNVKVCYPAPCSVEARQIAGVCGGKIIIEAESSGGMGDFSYAWDNGAGNAAQFNGAVSGTTYTVTATDEVGCEATASVTPVQTGNPEITPSFDAITCNGETTDIVLSVIGGLGEPYTYQWEESTSTTNTIEDVAAGTYHVTVSDANCSATASIPVTQPDAITFDITATDQVCTTSGTATVSNESNGVGSYSYVWHDSENNTVGNGTNELSANAGTYSVTVSDENGCESTALVTIGSSSTSVSFSTTPSNPTCSYQTGSIAVTDIVGTANYTVAWDGGSENGISDDHYTISNLGTGNYTITVTDGNGCSATQSGLSVSIPNEITYSVSTVDQVCSTAGSITLESVSGGAGGYSYQWSNSANEVVDNATNVLSGVNAGVYNVTVTDARGCEKIDAITLNGSGGTVSFTLVAHETLCHETASGRIEVQGITGRSPYSISWSSADASGNEDDVTASSYEISNIPAGDYTVVVTDADQCSYTSTANVGQTGEFNAIVSLNTPLKCNGDKFDLIAEATGGYLGGGSEYSYIWSNDATTQLLEGLTVFGTYSVSVRDDNGCEATATINVEEPTAVQIGITATEISCHGGTATITVSGEGGTGSYTGTGTFENITASATPYTYTIYDTNNCPASDNITITEPDELTVALTDRVDQTCSTQGSIRLTITGGSGTISYSWDGGDASTYTSAVTVPLGSGSHTVSVTDGNGCTASENVNIQNNSGMTVSLNSRQHTRCYEQDGGSFTLDFNNGTAPYEILTWNGETINETNPSHTFPNLIAGNYGVTVTDANGCSDNISVEVEDADEFTANASFTTPIMCHGDSFDITVEANGGTLASGHEYTYAWSNGIDTQSQNGLTTYTAYTVTVRDDNSCEAISSVEAVNPSEVRIIITADEISCHGGTATITVSGEGGTGSYTGTGTFENITASATPYTYIIYDTNDCSASDNITITEPEDLTITLTDIVDQTCSAQGSARLTITGGSGSLSYSWDGGDASTYTSAVTTLLGSGSHTVSVTDGNGCTATENVSIPNGSGMTLSPNPSQPARCFGENSGSVMIDFVNGTSPYTILWNGNLINETNDYHYFDNLIAGTYDVTVTDANGCSGNTSVEIGQPDDFVATASVTSAINCHDDAFDISASAQGGNGGYTYMWNGSVAGQSQSGLTEYSTYNVVVTDAEGCTATASVTSENPQELTITSIVADAISCHGGTTVVSAYAGGGSGTLNYIWATEGVPAVNSQQITAPAGTYSLTVTDGNGCWISTTYVVDTPDEISIEITRTTEQYCTTLGEVQLAVGGGTGNLSYTWDGNTINPIVGSSIVSQLSAGTHTLTVTDGNGCTAILPVTIDYGSEMSVAASLPDSVRCFGETNGEFTISMDDGFAPYTIVWNNGTVTEYSDLHTFANLSAGAYGVTVTDAHNCMEMISVEVGGPERLMALSSAERILCHGESAEVTVSATGGTLPYQNTGIYNLVAGEYDYMVTDANGCTSSTHVSLSEPTSISVNAVAVNALCFGGNGSATLMISGGTNPYSVVWQDNSTGLDNTHIPVNTNFGYTVTDLNGCTYDGTVTVGQPQQLSLDLSVTPVSCFGLEDAMVGVSHIGGGTLPYNYLWSNGNTMNSLVGVGAGTYSLLVTDANGCTISSTAVVTQPEALNVSVVSSNVECGISNGSLSANVYGGSQPYVYYWSNGGTSALLDNVSAGAYSLTVTDANGCSATSSSQINVAGMLSASIVEQSPVSCFGMTDATLVAVVEQAQPPVMCQWNNGQNGSTLFGLGTGMYIVTVTDGWGCQGVANYMLYSPTAMIMSSQVTDAKCSNTSEGAISLTVGGGRPPYSYLWTTGSTEPNLEDLRVGSYEVLVTDMSGCTLQENFVISAPTTISVEADVTDITCYGKKDGRVEINVSGGVEPYAYGFYMGNTVSHSGRIYEHLRPGIYNISVNDANGCGKSISVAVGQPERLGVNSMVSAPSCKDLHDATVEIVTAGGTAPFTYTLGTYTSDSSIFINLHPGLYSAVVTDANGCSNEISEIIVPESKLDCLRIPNVITPNGDGVNDEWIIENIELFPEAHIYVYNRWGQLLYHDRGNGERWDGSYRGHFVPSGVYMYIIKLESVEETYEGTVTVLY